MNPLTKAWRFIFDFSAGERENKMYAQSIASILTRAIAESDTDAGFEECFRSMIKSTSGLQVELAWTWLNRHLLEYRSGCEFETHFRVLAQRFLKDIPRRYGVRLDMESAGRPIENLHRRNT